jgi:uncharacterized surface protein with fasciclin (FAS1) repeats
MKTLRAAAFVSAALLALAAAAQEKAPAKKEAAPAKPGDVIAVATKEGNFKTLLKAIDAAGLKSTLKGAGPFTVFAPTDEAFAKLPKKDLDALLKDKAKLKAVLLGHVISGKKTAADVTAMKDGDKIPTEAKTELTLGLKDGKVTVDGAGVTRTDIEAANGVIHVIDTVILPKDIAVPPPASPSGASGSGATKTPK